MDFYEERKIQTAIALALKIAVLVFSLIAKFIFASIEQIIKNNLYLEQMNNNSEAFMNLQLYPIIGCSYYTIIVIVIVLIILDVVKIIRNSKGE